MIRYDKDVINVLKKSEEEAFKSNSDVVNINHFILSTLLLDNNVKKLFNKNSITYSLYKEKISIINSNKKSFIFYSLNLKKLLDLSYDTANRYSSNTVKLEHIFITLIDENINLQLLKDLNLNLEEFYKDLIKQLNNNSTQLIFDIGTDLTNLAKYNKLSKAVGREKEINEVIEILARKNKNNPILIGEAGVGKTAIVEELANLIYKGKVPSFLKNKKIISINIASIISGTKYRGEFEEKITKLLKECEARDDIILFIDEIHTIVGAGGAEGAIDASNILKPILARGSLKIIGATTINEYKKYITEDKALDRRFQKIYVNEPTIEETYNILKKIKNEYENFHNVKISDKLLKKIVFLSNKYIFDRNNPDKSIDILDEVCAATNILEEKLNSKNNNDKLNEIIAKKEEAIKNEDFRNALLYKEEEQKLKSEYNLSKTKKEVNINTLISIIESKCNSSIFDIETNKLYDYLKENLKKSIIGQDKNIDSIINRLSLLKNKKDNLPISFLIKGPSGTGKTMFAHELSKITNRNLIKLNMNEFSNEISVNKILGSPQGYVGYNDNNTVLEELKLKPNSIILFDDIDKAHYSIINIISKILEDGFLKNNKNEILNFKNAIVIFTSSSIIENNIGYINTGSKEETNLSDNFINNINYLITFNKLNISDIKEIINLEMKKFNYNYETNIVLASSDINNIINKSSYDISGGKNIKKELKNYVENMIIYTNAL